MLSRIHVGFRAQSRFRGTKELLLALLLTDLIRMVVSILDSELETACLSGMHCQRLPVYGMFGLWLVAICIDYSIVTLACFPNRDW